MPSSAPGAYPGVRPEREAAIAVAQQQASAVSGGNPVTRLWPFHILEQSGVAVAVSSSFTGPAVLDALVVEIPTGSNLPFETISVYVGEDNGGAGNNFALGTVPSGTRIFDNLSFQRDDANVSTDNRGFNPFNMNEAQIGFQTLKLGYLVTLQTFFAKVRVQNAVAAAGAIHGYMRVIEAIPPEQVANFL